jgi:hypothetical protein
MGILTLPAFVQAFLLAEEEGAPEIGVEHLLRAIDSPAPPREPLERPAGPYVPAPHRDKPLSIQARSAIEAACEATGADFESLSVAALRAALVRTQRGS